MWFIFLSLIPLFILPIWIFKYPVLADYPAHLFKVQVMKEYLNPVFEFSKYFTVYRFPCFYSLSYQVALWISKLLPLYVAGKIFLTVYVIILPLSVVYFLKSHGKSWLTAIFSFLLIYNSFLHKGNIGFVISIPATLFALGYLVRHQKPNLKDCIIGAILLLIVYLLHPYSFCVACFFILVKRELRKFLITLAPSIILLVINIFTLPGLTMLSIRWLSPFGKLRELGIYFLSFSYFKEALVIAPIYILYLYLFVKGDRKYNSIFFISLLAFFILPDHFMGGDHVAQRILPFAILFGMLSIKQTKYSFIIIPFLILQLWVTIGNWSYVNKVYDKYYKVLDAIPGKSKIEVVSTREDLYFGQISIFAHFQFYHHIAKGGISEPDFFNIPPVIYIGKYWDKKWAIEFKKLKEDYNIIAKKLALTPIN